MGNPLVAVSFARIRLALDRRPQIVCILPGAHVVRIDIVCIQPSLVAKTVQLSRFNDAVV
jgi:hypothetical protein